MDLRLYNFWGSLVRKCDLHLGSALSMPTSAASTREGTSHSTTSKFLFKVNTLTFTLNPLIVSWRKKEGTSLHYCHNSTYIGIIIVVKYQLVLFFWRNFAVRIIVDYSSKATEAAGLEAVAAAAARRAARRWPRRRPWAFAHDEHTQRRPKARTGKGEGGSG